MEEKTKEYRDTGLTSNMEDYIETIWMLSRDKKVVRVKDIAKSLDIKMPSVSAALNKLKDMELIDYEKYGFIELTEKGKTMAQQVYSRHTCLQEFFTKVLGMEDVNADEQACRVEHVLSPETCQRIHTFLSFYNSESDKKHSWVTRLANELKK